MTPEPNAPDRSSKGSAGDRRSAQSAGKFAGAGLQFALSIILFLYAGRWLDRRFGTGPWCLILGVFVGASAGFYSMYRQLMADVEREEREKGS